MTIRKKLVIIISTTLLLLMVILYFLATLILVHSYAEIEENGIKKDTQRALNAIRLDLTNLDIMVVDWAQWDDTYNFIKDKNPEYIKSNLNSDTLKALNLNLMLFVDTGGNIVHSKAYDLEKKIETSLPPKLMENISKDSPLVKHTSNTSSLSGIILLPEGPLLIASRPILTSKSQGPIRGTVIFGYYLDSTKLKQLAELTQLSLTLFRCDDQQMPTDFQKAASSLLEDSSQVFIQSSADLVDGYALLQDIYGEPALILRVDAERTIYQQGKMSLLYLLGVLLIGGFIFGITIAALLEKSLVSRLIKLNSDVTKVGLSGDPSSRVSEVGKDELSRLARAINGMLETLELSRSQWRESEERYRAVVNEQTELVFRYHPDRTITFVNQAFLRNFGKKLDEVIDRDFLSIFKIENQEEVKKHIAQLNPKNPTATLEFHNIDEKGQIHWQQWTTTAIFDVRGNLVEYQVVSRDITERKQMETALRLSEEFNRTIVENSPIGISVRDRNGHLLHVNTAWKRIWARSDEDVKIMLNRVITKLTFDQSDVYLGEHIDEVRRVYESGGFLHIPELKTTQSRPGEAKWVSQYFYALKDEEGNVERVIILTEDITVRKQTEEREKQYFQNLAILSESAMKFVELSPTEDIYQLVGERLQKLTDDSIIIVNSFDESTNQVRVRSIAGMDKYLEKVLKILGRHPIGMSFAPNQEAISALITGKLIKIPGGLHQLFFGAIPKPLCGELEKLFGLDEAYTMGFIWRGQLLGSAVVLTRKGDRNG